MLSILACNIVDWKFSVALLVDNCPQFIFKEVEKLEKKFLS